MSTLATQIIESEVVSGLRLFVMPTNAKRIVTIRGSLLGGEYFSPKENGLVAEMVVEMLDQGTTGHDKKSLHDLLDSRGISINFSSSRFHVGISAHCLSEDTSLTIEIISEMLRTPTFPAEELETLKKRAVGELQESESNTRARATIELVRKLYDPEHPNYLRTASEEIALMQKITRADLLAFHKKLGLGNMILVAVGDVDAKKFSAEVSKQFSGWGKSQLLVPKIISSKAPKSETVTIHIPDKTSVDVLLGTTIPFGDKHPDYYPLLMANMVLGATPTSRLMKEVREKKGLTYGTYSYVSGMGDDTTGHFSAWGTFAPELLKKGAEAMTSEVKKFVAGGITPNELRLKKETVIGGYKVGLSTTDGLAGVILSNATRGLPKEFIDDYPKLIEKISPKEVNSCIKKYLSSKNLVTVRAGTI